MRAICKLSALASSYKSIRDQADGFEPFLAFAGPDIMREIKRLADRFPGTVTNPNGELVAQPGKFLFLNTDRGSSQLMYNATISNAFAVNESGANLMATSPAHFWTGLPPTDGGGAADAGYYSCGDWNLSVNGPVGTFGRADKDSGVRLQMDSVPCMSDADFTNRLICISHPVLPGGI